MYTAPYSVFLFILFPQTDADGAESVLMALGSLCGATGYFQWESTVLTRKIELCGSIEEVPPHDLNLIRLAHKRCCMDTGYELIHCSDLIASSTR